LILKDGILLLVGKSTSSKYKLKNSPRLRLIKGKYILDSAFLFSDREIRGTLNNGEYFYVIKRTLNIISISIADTEYGLSSFKPINIAEVPFSDTVLSNEINIKKLLKILEWKYCEENIY